MLLDHFTEGEIGIGVLILILVGIWRPDKLQKLFNIVLATKAKAVEIKNAEKKGVKPPHFGVFTTAEKAPDIDKIIPKQHRRKSDPNKEGHDHSRRTD